MLEYRGVPVLRRHALVLGLLLCGASSRSVAAQAQVEGEARLALEPRSQLWLEGTSNLHDWRCDASEVSAEIRVVPNVVATPDVLPRQVAGVVVRVPVKGIRCQNDRMNQNLWKALRADQHPTIEFRMTGAQAVTDSSGADRVAFSVTGELGLAGATKPIDFMAVGADAGAGVRITGAAELLMTDFGIKPPTAMLGLLKTGDRVVVRFELMTSYKELAALLGVGDQALATTGWWW